MNIHINIYIYKYTNIYIYIFLFFFSSDLTLKQTDTEKCCQDPCLFGDNTNNDTDLKSTKEGYQDRLYP